MNGVAGTAGAESNQEWRFMLWSGAVFTALFVALVTFGGGRIESVLALPVLALILTLMRSVALALAALVVVLFVIFPLSLYSSAVWFSTFVALSFLINYRDFEWQELSSPLTIPLLAYGLAVLPSLVNAVDPWRSIALLFNVCAFLIAMYVTFLTVRSMTAIRRLVWVYLGMVLLNGIVLILIAITSERRQYGFAGIMYVDYAGLGISILAAITLLTSGARRMVTLGVTFLVGIALVLTQTRNAWLTTAVTLLFVVGYLIRYPFLAGVPRRRLVRYALVGGILLLVIAGGALMVNPAIEQRASDIMDTESVEAGESLIIRNSLITRLMIWDTALNAFVAHPWIGVGVYGFAPASQQYSRLPAVFYDIYVRNMSPHVTFLAVLSETGVIGLAGFFVFLGAILRLASRAVHDILELRGKRYAFVGLVAMTYCTVSMFVTDAWMWGQGIVLWGLIVGLILANRRIQSPAKSLHSETTARGVEG